MPNLSNKWPWILFVIVTLVGTFLRFWDIKSLPCGLFGDQALNGLEVLNGRILPYYSFYGEHDEGLFIIFLNILSRFIGLGQWQIFATTALIGSLTVPICMLVVAKIKIWPTALITGTLLASSPWHVALSRNGLRAIVTPIFLLLFAWILHQISVSHRLRSLWTVLLGTTIGLGFYSYSSFRSIVPVLAILGGYALAKRRLKDLFLAGITMIIVLIPLSIAFLHQPGELTSRASQVSIFKDQSIQTAQNLFQKNLSAIGLSLMGKGGDLLWRNNFGGEPLLPMYFSPLLLIGLALLLYKTFRGSFGSGLLLSAFVAFWFPGLLAYDTIPPHNMRLVGELPLIYFVVALGLVATINQILNPTKSTKITYFATLLILFFFSIKTFGLLSLAKENPTYASEFQCDHEEVAQETTKKYSSFDPNRIFVVGSLFDRYPIDFYRNIINLPNLKYLDQNTLSFEKIVPGDLVISPVYGELGFYHLDNPQTLDIIPSGGKNFLHALTQKYPDLKIIAVHYSDHPTRYPQGISFITLSRP